MKVAEFGPNGPAAQAAQTQQQPQIAAQSEPVRAVSDENRGATSSPTTMDTAPFDNKDRLKEAMKAAERLSEMSNRRLKFEYQEEADVFQVSVVDENNEIIRKIPSDNVLKMIENIERLVGLSIDTKA